MEDPHAWSGVVHSAVRALEEQAEVVRLQVPPVQDALLDRFLAKISGKMGFIYFPSDTFLATIRKSRSVRNLIKQHDVDAVISLAASKESLGIPAAVPLVQVTDSSFKAVIEGYFKHQKISPLTLFQGQVLDALVARRTNHYCVASQWSAQQLMKDLRVPESDITVVPFGPGVVPATEEREQGSSSGLSVLFIGSDWVRKGGERVLEAFKKARALRPDLTLTLVGAPTQEPMDGVTYLPRQSKEELSALYTSHDILLEPTEASAGGVVVTDALNHGLPVISTRIGGIPTLVKDGVTGWLVEPEKAVPAIVDLLTGLTKAQVEKAAAEAGRDAKERLTWGSWGSKVFEICQILTSR